MSWVLFGLNLSQAGHSAVFSSNAVFCFNWFIRRINLTGVITVLVTLEGISATGWKKKKNAEVLNQFTQGHLKLWPVKASQHNLSVLPGKFYYEYLVGGVNTKMSGFLVKKRVSSSLI